LLAVNASATFGNFPLTNGSFIAVSAWQCLHSGLTERCYAADVAPVALSLPENVYTGAIGDVSVTLTNWSGSNIVGNVYGSGYTVNESYVWSGPMSAAQIAAWDAKLGNIIRYFVDLQRLGSNYFDEQISAITNERIFMTSPCTSQDFVTNEYIVPVCPSVAPMLSQSSLWARMHIGTDFHYETGTNYPSQQNHSYQFTAQQTQNMEIILAAFACVVSNVFFTTNVNAGATNVTRNMQLSFGIPANFYYNSATEMQSVPVSCLDYQFRTSAIPFLRIRSANTNSASDFYGLKLYLRGLRVPLLHTDPLRP
jgi:hypothetical protein